MKKVVVLVVALVAVSAYAAAGGPRRTVRDSVSVAVQSSEAQSHPAACPRFEGGDNDGVCNRRPECHRDGKCPHEGDCPDEGEGPRCGRGRGRCH